MVVTRTIKGATKYYIQNVVSGSDLDENICGGMSTKYSEVFYAIAFLSTKFIDYPNVINVTDTSDLRK